MEASPLLLLLLSPLGLLLFLKAASTCTSMAIFSGMERWFSRCLMGPVPLLLEWIVLDPFERLPGSSRFISRNKIGSRFISRNKIDSLFTSKNKILQEIKLIIH
jgi:hypothetical protein